jgi:hypothetical protein
MRNILLIIIIAILLWALYYLNIQFGWINLKIEWTKVAIGVAAAGGPLQFLKNKYDEKVKEKQGIENEIKFRTINNKEYRNRETKLNEPVQASTESNLVKDTSEDKEEFTTNETAFG